jgi:hypothetical protein
MAAWSVLLPTSCAKGNGDAENTIASTRSMSFTMPMVRLISISSAVKLLPSRKLSTRAESAERCSFRASIGAMMNGQLITAHRMKSPSETKMTQME